MKLSHYIALMWILFLLPAKAQFSSHQRSNEKFKKPPLFNNITYNSTFSASYIRYHNWKYSGYNNFSFLTRQSVCYDSIAEKWETHIRFNGELGYMKFIDSTWYKNNDYCDFSTEFIKNDTKAISRMFTLYANTQFISDYETTFNDSGLLTREWRAGFGNPLNIDLGYGVNWTFWKNCRINLTYVTLRTTALPIYQVPDIDTNTNFVRNKTVIMSEYGLGLQTFIRHDLNDRIRWENYSRFFGNAVHRQKFNIDFRNRIVIKALKNLHLIFDSRIMYKPYPPYKFQFRNELMLTFVLEKY